MDSSSYKIQIVRLVWMCIMFLCGISQVYDLPTIYLDEDHAANNNYSIDDGESGTTKGSVSLESIFIHS